MAYLSKTQYDARRENAVERNMESSAVGIANGMTEEQADVMERMCCLRHRIHSDKPIVSDDGNIREILAELILDTIAVGLDWDKLHNIPIEDYGEPFVNIDTMDEVYEMYDAPEDGREDWTASHMARISSEWESVNGQIEDFMRDVDARYGTSYAPTGKQRIY